MEYKDFQRQVKEKIREYLPSEFKNADISINQQRKNNNVVLDALIIKGKENVVPAIYLEPFYRAYENGAEMDEVLQAIADQHHVGIENAIKFSVEDFQYERIKDNIFVTVQNAKMNQEWLQDIPHEIKEDLALVYRVAVEVSEGMKGSILIHNQHLEMWGINQETLKEKAWQNMHNKFQPEFFPMEDILKRLSKEIRGMDYEIMDTGMYVLTNDQHFHGAAYMFDERVMKEIGEILGTDVIVLPSSIHETILLKQREDMDYDMLKEMVRNVNGRVVEYGEILSDEVYLYERESQTLSKVCTQEQIQGMDMTM